MPATHSPTLSDDRTLEHDATGALDRPEVALDDSAIKKHENLSVDQLEHLKVNDDELVGNLTFNQLSLFEKKSVLVRPFRFLLRPRAS